jgi:hypothetical protein
MFLWVKLTIGISKENQQSFKDNKDLNPLIKFSLWYSWYGENFGLTNKEDQNILSLKTETGISVLTAVFKSADFYVLSLIR